MARRGKEKGENRSAVTSPIHDRFPKCAHALLLACSADSTALNERKKTLIENFCSLLFF